MDNYQYERDMRESARYALPLRRRLWLAFTVITLPIWILPYLIVRSFRR